MTYCLNPNCQHPQNSKLQLHCASCGTRLLLGLSYCSIKPIGQGGFGRTFLAVDDKLPDKNRCVIKQFSPPRFNSKTAIDLFQAEAERLKILGSHPQIPTFIDYIEQDGQYYIVQELIDGSNLEQQLLDEGPFNETQICQLLLDILPVLGFVHENRVIHRDIKPENIIRRDDDGKLVLVDFGAAKHATGTALAQTGTTIGSAGYTAPEQAMGKAITPSDLYSLGVTCIHLLTQVEPFELYSFSEDTWVWRDYLSSPVSDQMAHILDKLLSRGTRNRYQSATAILQDLTIMSAGTLPGDIIEAATIRSGLRSKIIVATVGVSALALGIGFATVQVFPSINQPPIFQSPLPKIQPHQAPVPKRIPPSPHKPYSTEQSESDKLDKLLPSFLGIAKSIILVCSLFTTIVGCSQAIKARREGSDMSPGLNMALAATLIWMTFNFTSSLFLGDVAEQSTSVIQSNK